jgi:hypothetical protein
MPTPVQATHHPVVRVEVHVDDVLVRVVDDAVEEVGRLEQVVEPLKGSVGRKVKSAPVNMGRVLRSTHGPVMLRAPEPRRDTYPFARLIQQFAHAPEKHQSPAVGGIVEILVCTVGIALTGDIAHPDMRCYPVIRPKPHLTSAVYQPRVNHTIRPVTPDETQIAVTCHNLLRYVARVPFDASRAAV